MNIPKKRGPMMSCSLPGGFSPGDEKISILSIPTTGSVIAATARTPISTTATLSGRKRGADALGRWAETIRSKKAAPPSLHAEKGPPTTAARSTDKGSTTGPASSLPVSSSSTSAEVLPPAPAATTGRGCLVGWTTCPLCGRHSSKRFALGRGIATHLHVVHAPWKPGRVERKKRRRTLERQQSESQRSNHANSSSCSPCVQDDDCDRVAMSSPRVLAHGAVAEKANTSETARNSNHNTLLTTWDPTEQEREVWDAQVFLIVQELELRASSAAAGAQQHDEANMRNTHFELAAQTMHPITTNTKHSTGTATTTAVPVQMVPAGYDRLGQVLSAPSYRDSLPPFLQAAAQGDLETIRAMVKAAMTHQQIASSGDDMNINNKDDGDEGQRYGREEGRLLLSVLNRRDRHGSTAEHWAAGGGHLACLKYILEQRRRITVLARPTSSAFQSEVGQETTSTRNPKKMRRRDGKTCLHYAARYGRLECVQYLLDVLQESFSVDEVSGDGTTPLHLACFGGHDPIVEYLIGRGANVQATNEYGCQAAHWVAMSASPSGGAIRQLCDRLRGAGVSFVQNQKQGHSAMHKAAQRLNRTVIEWMLRPTDQGGLRREEKHQAAQPDQGGYTPSDIWRLAGGDESFAQFMDVELKR